MKKKLAMLCLVVPLYAGCGLFTPQLVQLDPVQVAALEMKVGKVTTASQEALRAEVQRMLQTTIESVDVSNGKVIAKLPGVAPDVGGTGLDAFLTTSKNNPGTTGLFVAAIAAISAATDRWRTRKKLEAQAPK